MNTFRFKNGEHYEGETLFGGCGYVNRNVIHLLKRTKNYVIYQDQWGKIHKTRRMYHIKCEFLRNSFESFYADSIGAHMRFQLKE
ncbi:MAG: hypothetical protein H6R01_1201 [Burkholderiaceae bacterium]|nr:hypothetical protein [Burkholderiaceae bacterium]